MHGEIPCPLAVTRRPTRSISEDLTTQPSPSTAQLPAGVRAILNRRTGLPILVVDDTFTEPSPGWSGRQGYHVERSCVSSQILAAASTIVSQKAVGSDSAFASIGYEPLPDVVSILTNFLSEAAVLSLIRDQAGAVDPRDFRIIHSPNLTVSR